MESHRPKLAFLGLLVLFAACGGGDDSPGSVRRVALAPLVEAPPPPEATRVAMIEVGAEVPPWTTHGGEPFVRRLRGQAAGGRSALCVHPSGTGTPRIEVPGPFDARAFNVVRVGVHAPKGGDVRVAAMRRGRLIEFAMSEAKSFTARKGLQFARFELPKLRREPGSIDAIAVLFPARGAAKRTGDVPGFFSVELLHEPWPSWLPDPAGEFEMVAIEGDARPAKCLAASAPLGASFDAVEDARLVVSLGIPAELRARAGEAVVTIRLCGARGREIVREVALEAAPDRPAHWQSAEVDLSGFEAGERVEATFELAPDDADEIVAALGEPALVRTGGSAPTVVLITSDTHRADYLGVAGGGIDVRTPFLDALAERGTYFTNCTAAANVTNPSHVALMTAYSPRDTRVTGNLRPARGDVETLAERFRDAGWATLAAVSANHLGDQQSGLGQGFDRMSVPSDAQRDSRSAVDHLTSWIPDADGVPLFVWLHLFDAHAPYEAKAPHHEVYWRQPRDPADPALPPLPKPAFEPWLGEIRDLEYVETLYRSEVSYVDEQVERLLTLPRARDAIVAFTADHGESLGGHDIYWDHRELYPENLFVPLILAGPGVPSGARCDLAVEQTSTGRTLLNLAGLGDAAFPGADLLRVASGEALEAGPRFALSAHAMSSSVLAGKWFLVLHLQNHNFAPTQPGRRMHEIELYDVQADPGCTRNLAGEETERAAALRASLVEWLVTARPLATTSGEEEEESEAVDSEAIANLEALGYTGGLDAPVAEWIDPECACERCAPFKE